MWRRACMTLASAIVRTSNVTLASGTSMPMHDGGHHALANCRDLCVLALVGVACGNAGSSKPPTRPRRRRTAGPTTDGRAPPTSRRTCRSTAPGRHRHRDQGRGRSPPRRNNLTGELRAARRRHQGVLRRWSTTSGGIYGRKLVDRATTATTSSARTARPCSRASRRTRRSRRSSRPRSSPAPTCSPRRSSRRSSGTSTPSSPATPPSSRTTARSASRARATSCPGSPSSWARPRSACSRTASRRSRRTARQGIKALVREVPDRARSCSTTTRSVTRRPLGPQVTQMKEKGVQFVMTCVDLQESFTLAKEMQKQGMKAVQSLPERLRPRLHRQERRAARGLDRRPAVRRARERRRRSPRSQKLFEVGAARPTSRCTSSPPSDGIAAEFYTGLAGAGPEFSQAKVVAYLNTLTRLHRQRLHPADRLDQGPQRSRSSIPRRAARTSARNFVKVENGKFVPVFGEAGQAVGVLQADRSQRSTTRRT